MNKRPSRPGQGRPHKSGPNKGGPNRGGPGPHKPRAAVPARRPPKGGADADAIVERKPLPTSEEPGPFRVLIAVHRPRFRGRCERAAALEGWEVVSLLNRQDPVGIVQKPPRPPDLLVLSGDFGRQKDYAIFRAVQPGRAKGMKLVGLVDDCETPPEGFPDSAPARLCDVCQPPPYKAADLRLLFARLYEEMRGEPAPPPVHRAGDAETEDEDAEGEA